MNNVSEAFRFLLCPLMTTLRPIEDHVLIEPIEAENITSSGIILPDSKEKPSKGKVLAV